MNLHLLPAANDDGPRHDLFSIIQRLDSFQYLTLRQLEWLVPQLEGRNITQVTLGELLALIDRAHTLPRLVESGHACPPCAHGQGGVA
ncbi:MAG: hypothetical protein Q4B94_01845 [Pseudomonadota bacterium]|nr:hypothetical protein [Pseudomonadota bacterium]